MEDYNGTPNQWEVVLLSNVVYHVAPPLSYQLDRMYELVKPGGTMVVVVGDGHVTDSFNVYDYLGEPLILQLSNSVNFISLFGKSSWILI